MTSLKGRVTENASALCSWIDLKPASDRLKIAQELERIKEEFRPGEPGRPKLIAAAGDQPAFKILFDLWREGMIIRKSRELACFAPTPGGMRAEKHLVIPMRKFVASGAFMNELVRPAGLSACHADHWEELGRIRKSRRALLSVMIAEIARAADALRQANPALQSILTGELEKLREGEEKGARSNEAPGKAAARLSKGSAWSYLSLWPRAHLLRAK